MRAILIDPKAKTITEVEHNGDYKEIYKLIGADTFQGVGVNERNVLYVDDNGLFQPDQHYFKWGPQEHLAGKGLVLGVDEEGESTDVSIPLDKVQSDVHFYDVQPVFDGMETTEGETVHPQLGAVHTIRQEAKFK